MRSSGKIRVEVKNPLNGRWMPHATYRDSEQGEREAKTEIDRLSSAGYVVRAMASGGVCVGIDGFRTQPDIRSTRWPPFRNRTSAAHKTKRKRTWLPITL